MASAVPEEVAKPAVGARLQITAPEWTALALITVGIVVLGVITGEWLGLIGVGTTVVGLAIAVRQILMAQSQIAQTLSVAQATRQAVTHTEAQLARHELIGLIPQLQRVDRELATAARAENAEELAAQLADWRDRAYQFIGLLEDRDYASDSLLTSMYDSAKTAASLVVELPDAGAEARIETKLIRAEISGVCGRLGILESKLKLHTGQGGHGTAN